MLLFRLGLAHPVKEDGTIIADYSDRYLYAGSFAMAVDGNKAAAVVAERASSGALDMPPIDEVLAAWLACAYFFKLAGVTPEPFVPHDDVQAVM